jgi:hypothetical protein
MSCASGRGRSGFSSFSRQGAAQVADPGSPGSYAEVKGQLGSERKPFKTSGYIGEQTLERFNKAKIPYENDDRYIPPPANVEFAVLPPAILAPDGVVYATSYGGMLHAFEAETGNLVWTLPLGNGTLGLVAGAGHLLFANDAAGTLVVDVTGRKIVGRLNVDGQPAKVGSPLGGTGSALLSWATFAALSLAAQGPEIRLGVVAD